MVEVTCLNPRLWMERLSSLMGQLPQTEHAISSLPQFSATWIIKYKFDTVHNTGIVTHSTYYVLVGALSIALGEKQCCGSGSGIRCLFDPMDLGSGIGFFRIPDLGSNPYFWELIDNCLGKKFYNSLKIGPNFFFSTSKLKLFAILWNLWLHKKLWQQFFFHPSLLLMFLHPESEIRDPGWVKLGIRDPG